ncbi:hydantoinase/oxoprolinase family protein [Bradyrhizobium sp. BWA-3-5]|uniref:hydantoinase/oxoprolinase family protein n=1 Tax=Bradyrhizobium sp. BWA-3-5 TaxID=3080013 RepID=UPI00293F58FA|nr:hydantoinase/oxoprolinase family protein [Bradyrhizobium sp. BWA-3-5]WOH63744.1 hydantoinase/oxoprolinase family protein [Bradyrhizobium sp. BWA-3-5]
MGWRIGVDSGGTFTDVCLFEESSGRLDVWKVPSTPADPSIAIVQGLQEGVAEVGAKLSDVAYFGHGTTVSTNALIQGRGVKTGLITTDGFRDLLEIARQRRPDLYDLQADKPEALVSRDLRIEVPERVLHTGSVETPLDEAALRAAVRKLKEAKVEAVAVCFLYSFIESRHEEIAARVLKEEFPEAFSSVSHKVAPEFREYERMSTAVVNGYLGPVMQGYVKRLVSRLDDLKVPASPHLTQSNGGVIGPDTAAELPVRTVLSGPSTGVVAAQALGEMTGIKNLITFDMGGTSTDVALLTNGLCRLVNEAVVHGYPIKAPMLDIHTVGAGGGSIAYVDTGGLLKVGPRSAGAFPGPSCYGNGNQEPAVTDANVLLQTLNPTHLLNGRMKIDQELSRKAIQAIADKLGLDVLETANGILQIVTANMSKAIRVISVQRGYDPRDYTMVAFGGAGPVHAARLAEELGIGRILVPLTPGILCAMGLLMTDLRTDFAITKLRVLDTVSTDEIQDIYDTLESRAKQWFDAEHIRPERRSVHRTVDVRYLGQNYEIAVPVSLGEITKDTFDKVRESFLAQHKQFYGFVAEGEPVQLVTFRLEAIGVVDKAQLKGYKPAGEDSSKAVAGARKVWDFKTQRFLETKLYDRGRLQAGNIIKGPAIIDQMDSTTVVPSHMLARVDNHLNLILEAQ